MVVSIYFLVDVDFTCDRLEKMKEVYWLESVYVKKGVLVLITS